MRFKDIHVGDKLRIRDWDDMAAEYGVTYNQINAPIVFTDGMRQLCGKTFTVKGAYDYEDPNPSLASEEGLEYKASSGGSLSPMHWHIIAEMLEPAIEPLSSGDDINITSLLFEE